MSERPWVKVYREIIDDPRFETIYMDDRNLATWLRMLLLADAMYPAPAPVAGFSRRAIVALCAPKCGLIELVGTRHFRLHGLKTERSQQSDAGKAGAAARWGRMAPASDPGMGCDAYQPNPDQTNSDQPNPAVIEPALEAYQLVCPNVSANALRFLDELIAEFGQEPTARAIGQASLKGRDTLLSRTKTLLVLGVRGDVQAKASAQNARQTADRTARQQAETERRRRLMSTEPKPLSELLPGVAALVKKETE